MEHELHEGDITSSFHSPNKFLGTWGVIELITNEQMVLEVWCYCQEVAYRLHFFFYKILQSCVVKMMECRTFKSSIRGIVTIK